MSNFSWRWASASVVGTSHLRIGAKLQDAYTVSDLGNGCFFAVVSDGAGSAEFGRYGAWLTCRSLLVKFRSWVRENQELPSDVILSKWVAAVRTQISELAFKRNSAPRQFAATLAAIFVTPDGIVSFHVGDSAIVGRKEHEWEVLCWPENGEYASSTYFVTDTPESRLHINRYSCEYDALALFSDGVGDLALSHLEQSAHAGFFNPMIRPIDSASGEGRLIELSEKLASYLAGSQVCERTDDDKTLILISKV